MARFTVTRSRLVTVAAVTVGVSLTVGGLSYAVSSSSSSAVITACENVKTGALRLPTKTSCRTNARGAKRERVVSWNQAGAPGVAGATGTSGPSGATGPSGLAGGAGLQGDPGATGGTGPKGDTGDTGPKGDKGDTGQAGPVLEKTWNFRGVLPYYDTVDTSDPVTIGRWTVRAQCKSDWNFKDRVIINLDGQPNVPDDFDTDSPPAGVNSWFNVAAIPPFQGQYRSDQEFAPPDYNDHRTGLATRTIQAVARDGSTALTLIASRYRPTDTGPDGLDDDCWFVLNASVSDDAGS